MDDDDIVGQGCLQPVVLIISALALSACSTPRTLPAVTSPPPERGHQSASPSKPPTEIRLAITPPPAYKFIHLAWDPNQEPDIAGYKLYMGEQPGTYYGGVKMDLEHHLHGKPEVPFLVNHPVTYLAVSAYNEAGLEGPVSNELRYPAIGTFP